MPPSRGAYFLAHDGFLDLATAFLNSFRRFNPELPLCVIPFADDLDELLKLRTRHDFTVLDDPEALAVCDAIGTALRGAPYGHFRKLAMWEGDFDEFVYFDSDTVVLHDVGFAFDLLADHDFITAHGNDPKVRQYVWNDSIEQTGKLTQEQIDFAGCTGFIASRKECLSLDRALRQLPEAIDLVPHMCAGLKDQPLLNYLMVTSGHRCASLYGLSREGRTDLPLEWWAGDPIESVQDGQVVWPYQHPPLFVHWSERAKQGAQATANRDLWDFYREPTETGGDLPAPRIARTIASKLTCSFEDGTTQGWTSRSGDAHVHVTNGRAHSGSRSLLTEGRTEPWHGPRLTLPVEPHPGGTYHFALWARLASGEAPAELKLSIERHALGVVHYEPVLADTPVTADDWCELKGTYTLRHPSTELVVYAESSAGTASFHLDDFSMTVEEEPGESPLAATSVLDSELIRTVLLNAASFRPGRPLRVLEWGAGRSTLSYPRILKEAGVPYRWTSLEYDRAWLEAEMLPQLATRPEASVHFVDDGTTPPETPATEEARIDLLCWSRGPLYPFFGETHAADRAADLDDYVAYPTTTGSEYDVVLVDGRKRRRCLLMAQQLLHDRTVVLLHDAARPYYHCALETYPAGRFIGDDLWIGGATTELLDEALRRA